MNSEYSNKEEVLQKTWTFNSSDFINSLVISTTSAFVVVFFLTNIIEFIARQEPTWINIKIFWPTILYLGAIIGGMIGTTLSYIELKLWQENNYSITPGKIAPNDLVYIILLFIMTYALEILSESLILQGIMYLLEIGFFIVFSRNLTKLTLEKPKEETDDDTRITL
ncbi:MAG: hypothetical protein ACTSW1_11295 [Candidatus Hodarchaeales archaeon]